MKIAFLASSFEPGRDGVGDYTRMLARACEGLGHKCFLVALHDRWVEPGNTADSDSVLRISSTVPWGKRGELLQRFVGLHQPDIISVQYVNFGFDTRGLPFGFRRLIPRLPRHILWHWMMHELWVEDFRGSLKKRVLGWLQRQLAISLWQQSFAKLIHTSNLTYADKVMQAGFAVSVLPLFGAVPQISEQQVERMSATFPEFARERQRCLVGGIFGTLHPVWPAEPLLPQWVEHARKSNKWPVLLSLGNIGTGQALWDELKLRYAGQMEFHQLGEMLPEQLAAAFRQLDFGIATTPLALIGKSSAATAMLEHGLPLVVNRDDVAHPTSGRVSHPVFPERIITLGPDFSGRLGHLEKFVPRSILPDVAGSFCRQLQGMMKGASASARNQF
jgi:hypothetical protein